MTGLKMTNAETTDFAVVGGGMIGAAVAYGLSSRGARVILFDEGDVALRAARGNLGNIWVQGKGATGPAYADLTRAAANEWSVFAHRLEELSGYDLHYRRPGGFYFCFSADELARRKAMLQKIDNEATVSSGFETFDNDQLRARFFPEIGAAVAGATYSADDGSVNPFHLLKALLSAAQKSGATYLPFHPVDKITADRNQFVLQASGRRFHAGKVIMSSGLGNLRFAADLGMNVPIRPVRGQIMVTEKLKPFLRYGVNFVRQTVEGSCIFGESSEEAGFDESTTRPVLRETAQRMIAAFPLLRNVRVVRSWGALRVISPDGMPIYAHSSKHEGAYTLSVHSGVTLAPFHAGALAQALLADKTDCDSFKSFSPDRFNVSNSSTVV